MAQKLKFGNGTWATKEGSTLAYNDENNNYKPLPFTTTRNSIATRVNKEGLIEVVGNNIPRIDYTDSADGVLLLEPSRSNIALYSEDFSNVFWTKSGSSIASNNAISPDGTLNASKLVETTSNSAHRIFNGSGLSVSGNVSMSVFAKKGGRNFIRLTNNNIVGAFFDLNNGIVLGVSGGITAKIEDFGNDWYRCSITQSGVANERLIIYLSNNGVDTSYIGDGSSGVYIYGTQLEQGSYPTSYIPTSGSSVTRQADTASGSGNSEVFNSQEGVLFLDTKALSNDGTTRTIGLSDGSNSNRIHFIYYSITNGYSVNYRVSDSTQVAFTKLGNILDYQKIAFKYKSGDFSLWYNGFEIDTDNNTNMMAQGVLNTLSFRQEPNSHNYIGKTKEIGYYDEILTDLELEYLTSYRSLNELVTELNLNTL